jgi:hypothetical protein
LQDETAVQAGDHAADSKLNRRWGCWGLAATATTAAGGQQPKTKGRNNEVPGKHAEIPLHTPHA